MCTRRKVGECFWESHAHNSPQVCRCRLCLEGHWNGRSQDQVHKTHCNLPDVIVGSWMWTGVQLIKTCCGLCARSLKDRRPLIKAGSAVRRPRLAILKLLISPASVLKQGRLGTRLPASSLCDSSMGRSWPTSHIRRSLSAGFLSKRHTLLKQGTASRTQRHLGRWRDTFG